MDTKIAIETLDLYYSEFHALKNINMRIPEKEITAFIGPSGCGKSTLLKSLNRMNDLIEGCRITGRVLPMTMLICCVNVWAWFFKSRILFR